MLLFLATAMSYSQETRIDFGNYGAITRKNTAGMVVGGFVLQAIGVGGIVGAIYLSNENPAFEDDENSLPEIIGSTSAGIFILGTGIMINGFKIISNSRKTLREIRKNQNIPRDNWGIQITGDGIGLVYRF